MNRRELLKVGLCVVADGLKPMQVGAVVPWQFQRVDGSPVLWEVTGLPAGDWPKITFVGKRGVEYRLNSLEVRKYIDSGVWTFDANVDGVGYFRRFESMPEEIEIDLIDAPPIDSRPHTP